jgi:hypothetical protein
MSKDSPSKPVRVIGRVRDDVPGKRPRWFQEAASTLPEASVEEVHGKQKWGLLRLSAE